MLLWEGAGQSILPSSGCCLASEQSISVLRPSGPALLPWLFPGELSSRAADLARNCSSPLQQEI